MRKILNKIYRPHFIFAGFLCLLITFVSSSAWAGWVAQNSGTTELLQSVHFPVDANTGYTVGFNGVILKTIDGGTNWVSQNSGTAQLLYDVHFPVDATTGFVAGGGGTILKTTNGGSNWITKNTGAYTLRSIHFPADTTTGYAVGSGGVILKTTDGGENWSPQTSGTTDPLYSVHFPIDATTGYAAGWSNNIYKTTDGGTNWTPQSIGGSEIIAAVYFPVDAITGYTAGMGGTVRKTTDGGSNWNLITSGTTEALQGLHFPTGAIGYIVGNSGTLRKTTDSGASWVGQDAGVADTLMAVHFPVDANTGYAVGFNGTIIKTTDGGGDQPALHPTGNGTTNQFSSTGSCALGNWDCINDQTGNAGSGDVEVNDSTNYLTGSTGQRVMFKLDNVPGNGIPAGSTITAIEIFAQTYAGNGSSPNASFSYQRMPGATTPDASPVDATGEDWSKNCCTIRSALWSGLSWTTDDLDNLDVGVVHNSGGADINITQLYVVISYEAGGGPTTTIGDGSAPADKNVLPDDTNKAVNAFSLVTSSGSDTLTDLVVSFTGTDVNDVKTNGVKIYEDKGSIPNEWDSGDDPAIASASFSGGTATFNGLSIPIDTSSTQYLITYDIVSSPGAGNTLQGAVNSATVSTNDPPTINDNNDATLTITSYCNVTTFTDGVAGSLRNCIQWANGNAGADSIIVPAGIYDLTVDGIGEDASVTGDLDIDGDLTITGAGASSTIIDAVNLSPRDRAFHLISGDINMDNLTIRKGDAGGNEGGGIYAPSGGASSLTLTDVVVSGNNANHGGGIRTSITTTLNDVEVSSNTASFFGGGIRNDISLTWIGGTSSGNNATNGAGIANIGPSGNVDLTNVTMSGNIASSGGGGLYNEKTATLTNITIYGNTASSGGGISRSGGSSTTVKNTIVANNTGGNCNNSVTTNGGNLESATNTCSFSDPSDQVNVTAGQLNISNTLAYNGGTTKTHALLSGSFAIDEAVLANCPTADQRGTSRGIDGDATPNSPEVGDCDIGAYEYDPASLTTTIGDGTTPSDKTVAHNSINNAVNAFTLSTSSGSDTLTQLILTFTGSAASDVAGSGVKIYKDDGTNPNEWDSSDTQIGSSVSFSGVTATFGSLSEAINTTPTQYLITYDIAGSATSSNTLQGAVTAVTVTNTLVNNDSNDATLTVDSGPYNVYYSVGQNTNDHKTGSPTMTIVNGTATFSTPQTTSNLGVGDKVTYNGGDIAYISGKTSTSVWSLKTARGSTPANVTNATVDSITHAYASLSAAEAGATDAAHLNTTDLVSGDYVLHFPCYYDSGPDGTAVTIDGYTTGANNYIRVYTPTDTASDVNQSQRHDGKWNNGKYYIDVGAGSNLPLVLSDEHIRVDGLQITTTYVNAGSSAQAIYLNNVGNNADIRISNNVLNGGNVGTAGDWNRFGIIITGVGTSSEVRIWNNMIYEWGGKGWGIYVSEPDVTAYVYNNTIYDNPWFGIRVANGSVVAKNNLVFGSGDANTYSGTFTAGTDYNSTDSTDNIGQGSNNRISQTFTFVNTGTDDYHLASTDTGALNRGVDLSSDPNLAFSVDIDGATRPIDGIWDIGADETAGSIFTTIGDGTTPSDKTVAHNSINNAVNAFTLSTSSGSDTLTELVVTFSGDSASDVAASGAKIYKDDGTNPNEWDSSDTQISSAVSFSGVTATFSSLSEAINSTPTQYLITYDIAAGAGSGNTLQGAVTAATVSNSLVNNDSNDATLTVDSGPYNVYYSVGQSTVTNLMTGTPTMTICGGTATFSTPQTATNMGIGDKVTYNGGDIAYISGKTSTSVWSLLTARGSTPANVTNATVDSITHAYASLSAAEAGATDAAHLNTTNLVTGDYVLNIPCYYDTGPDSSAEVDGYTTGPNNYIKIYTPNDTSTEVNQSQRHDGKYNATKYIMQLATGVILAIKDNYVRVDGLQFRSTSNAASNYHINVTNDIVGVGDVRLSHNYIEGSNNTTGNAKGIYVYSGLSSSFVARIWNNIVYNIGTSGGSTQGMIILDTDVTGYVYNNTQSRSNAYWVESTNIIVKNQMLLGGWYIGAGYSASSTNNAGDNGTPPGSNPITLSSSTATDYFVSASDLHINPAATYANEILNSGVDLSSDPNLAFSVDIDGETRPYNIFWDVGADEETSLPTYSISGKVFEDKVIDNGAGGPFNGGEGDAGIDGVRVELFRASDSLFIGFTTTAGGGNYSFSSLGGSTNYKVRVVASTVDGSGGALGEQSFESDGTTDYGTFTTAMGGQAAATADTVTLSTLTGAEHWVQVSVAAANVTGVDFGFSYDLIVNSNDTGQGSLRQFITNASDIAGANTSKFNIPATDGNYQNGGAGASYWRIQPVLTYTISAGDISIDGSTQTTNATALGYFVNASGPEVEIDGSLAGAVDGITVTSANNTIKDLIMNGYAQPLYGAVRINGAGATGNTVKSSYIGTNYAGTAAAPNNTGIYISNGANGNTIGGTTPADRNIISGNSANGIHLSNAGTNDNKIYGNYIGTDAGGTADLGNTVNGILIDDSASNNKIGDTIADTGNVISGNNTDGIYIEGAGTSGNTILKNYIGTNAAGDTDLGNTTRGIYITNAGTNNIGDAAGNGNLISGNNDSGIQISGTTSNITIQGNSIGTNLARSAVIKNNSYGIYIDAGSNFTIGGTAAGAENTVSIDNGSAAIGIGGSTSDVTVHGNYLGTDITETVNLGGVSGVGVLVMSNADPSNIDIGGVNTDEGNVIANASSETILMMSGATSVDVMGNTIYNNSFNAMDIYDVDAAIAMNLIRDNGDNGIELHGGAINTNIYHNTIHGNTGDGIEINDAGITGTIIKNNIITANGGWGINNSIGATITNDYNNVPASPTAQGNTSGSCTGCSLGSGSLSVDPLYNDESGDDYTLTECTSPAINMACNLGAAGDDTFCDIASDGAQPDLVNGTGAPLSTKFNNNAPDMGAYETVDCDPGLTIVKQVWEDGGTAPLSNPTAPVGATLVFLIYVKNTTAGPVTDLRINDDLDDAGFAYVADSLIMDDGSLVDSSSDEDIFDATASGTGTPLSDVVDANLASSCDVSESLCPGSSADKITIGAVVGQANASLSIGAHETFALRFKVKVK